MLTVKLFGETLKAPRILAVWHDERQCNTSVCQACRVRIPHDLSASVTVTQCGGPSIMAKALLGYVGGSDPRLLAEMRRLQQRVQDLESELTRIQSENDALTAAASQDRIMESIDAHQAEPALT
ncbi:hypothetical protein HEK131_47770 [Streptomyces seoulensis]|nr:hypothetical protein HEK131_47770 [Streptomyces seoulensis]